MKPITVFWTVEDFYYGYRLTKVLSHNAFDRSIMYILYDIINIYVWFELRGE